MQVKLVVIKLMAFLACWYHCANCLSFSVLLPLMVEPPELPSECTKPERETGAPLAWTHLEQGFVLAGLGVGYFLALLMSAPVANTVGPRWVVFTATMVSGTSVVLLPLVAEVHWAVVMVARAFTGAAGGVIPDSILTLMNHWLPRRHKFHFGAIFFAGVFLGVCGSWLLCGLLLERVTWPVVFYVMGALTLLFGVVWVAVVHDEPPEESDADTSEDIDLPDEFAEYSDYVPLGTVFSSCPFLTLACTHFADVWGITMLFLLIPKFVYEILDISILQTTLICVAAASCRFLLSFLLLLIVKYMIKYDCLDVTSIRKMFVFISHLFTGVTVVAVGYVGCSPRWMLMTLSLAMALSGFASVTSESNARDLSPAFVRLLFVCMHFFALTSTIILPVLMGIFVYEADYVMGWIYVFYLTAAVYIISGFIFLIFGSGDVQPWNFPHLFMMAHTSLNGTFKRSVHMQKFAGRGKGRPSAGGRLRRLRRSFITRPDA